MEKRTKLVDKKNSHWVASLLKTHD